MTSTLTPSAELKELLETAKSKAVALQAQRAGTKGAAPTVLVLSGGPGIGKTSLVEHVQAKTGCRVSTWTKCLGQRCGLMLAMP